MTLLQYGMKEMKSDIISIYYYIIYTEKIKAIDSAFATHILALATQSTSRIQRTLSQATLHLSVALELKREIQVPWLLRVRNARRHSPPEENET